MNTNIGVSRLLTHSIGWTTVIGISFFIPAPMYVTNPVANVFFNSIILISAFYINYIVLVPKVYLKHSHGWYFLSALLLLMAAWLCYTTIIHFLNDPSFSPESQMFRERFKDRRPSASTIRYFRSIPLTALTVVGILISLLIALQENNRKKELEIASVKASLLNQELGMLRSQINPHFLFNALNNIYSMSINRPNQVGPVILKLSEMLRYVLYDISETGVSINKEISYISNYIELFKLKDSAKIKITFNSTPSELKINPMILIVFVENSFKHSRIAQEKDGYIIIDLKIENHLLFFEVKNSLPTKQSIHKESQGIGIENVRKRLELMYPDRHELTIHRSEKEFYVKLNILLDS